MCCRSNPSRKISPSTRIFPLARLAPVQEQASKAGLWAPQSPKEFGGMALPIVAWAAIYEEAARSLFGPLSINCAAPDDGNMNLLSRTRHAGAEGMVAAADRRRQGQILLRHDRAGAGRRLRSGHDPHLCREEEAANGSSAAANGSSPAPRRRRISSSSRAPPTTSAAGSPPFSITATSRAGASSAASRSWGRRSMAGTANSNSTASRSPTKTSCSASATG